MKITKDSLPALAVAIPLILTAAATMTTIFQISPNYLRAAMLVGISKKEWDKNQLLKQLIS
ncbi:hypothetical protein D822_08872 [Streptococcus ratti FA-1 = DSM 20564]|uniref:Uncharacterized protein n=1 Tax=Streptococcus ratti FA-1 = DSM 20564 TaxID=699248 RepID=A0ABP2R236_STRRT|nr:hypothetical protein SRA_06341 [Streptococcus ratti FA-1 = DSM 20564]EMP68980.1 hypothetical protein D822_08872 [Streptococcus ratti FA-1 = DSM 20564]